MKLLYGSSVMLGDLTGLNFRAAVTHLLEQPPCNLVTSTRKIQLYMQLPYLHPSPPHTHTQCTCMICEAIQGCMYQLYITPLGGMLLVYRHETRGVWTRGSYIGPRARVPINRNIRVRGVITDLYFVAMWFGRFYLARLGYRFFLHTFLSQFVTTSCHCYRNSLRNRQSVLGQCVCSLVLRSQCGFVIKLTQLQQWLFVCLCSCGCTLA